MYLFNWMRSASFPEEIKDEVLVKSKYKYWRIRTFYGMYIGYAFYYFTRKSFTFAIPSMLDYGFTLSELGTLGTILSVIYGFSKFISGILGDRTNPRYFMSVGLILTGLCNICFGLSSMWVLLALFWGLNAWFQGWGWPGCAKLLTHWYSQSERGTWWSLWNTSHNIGGALIPLLAAFCVQCYGWRFAMFIPGIICIAIGFFLMNRLRDIPQSLGLPPIEQFRGEICRSTSEKETEHTLPIRTLLVQYVLSNKYLWLIAFAYFFIYFIRTGFNDWCMVYLIKFKSYSDMQAAACILCFEIGGFLGSLVAGWSSDKLFNGKRNPVNVLFAIGATAMLFSMHWNKMNIPFLDGTLVFLNGFFIFGPQMLIGMVAAELTHKKAAATSSGFAGCFAYIGAAMAGGPLGSLISAWGWDYFFAVLCGCGILAIALLLPLWSIKTTPALQEDKNIAGEKI